MNAQNSLINSNNSGHPTNSGHLKRQPISDELIEVTGLEALYLAAIDSGVKMVTSVAGFPTTAVIEHFESNSPSDVPILWMTNEKSALETALGASVSGRRALTITKHVGMNVLSDPLLTSVTHTIGSGLVIIAGDDPGALASQNEQDSRFYGEIAEVVVFDPSCPEDAYESMLKAFEISEATRSPVILRLTDRLLKATGTITRYELEVKNIVFDRSIWNYTMRGKHQLFHSKTRPIIENESESADLDHLTKKGNVGIISSGYPSSLVSKSISEDHHDISHLELNIVCPLPTKLVSQFLKDHEIVIVVEESEPFIESHIATHSHVRGKLTGHLPHGRIEIEHIDSAISNYKLDYVETSTEVETIKKRGARLLCEGCLFLPVYMMLRELDLLIAGDMGCSIRSAPRSIGAVDVGFALGAAISTATGFDKKSIAVIGDFGLAHSGIVSLINAVHNQRDVLVLVLDNHTAAMTGGQSVPDLTDTVKTLCDDTTIFEFNDPELADSRIAELRVIIENKLKITGVSVIYVKADCILYQQNKNDKPMKIK